MKKRLTAILLALVLMMGLTTFAAAEEGIPTAATFDELVAAMENGATTVEITGTISVTGNLGNNDVTITLTRSADFADGALLQIEQGEIKNLIVSGADIDTESPLAIISGSCLISNTAFTNCTDSAVVITTGTAMFENCSFEDNSGTHITNDAEAVFTKCSFSDGQSKDNGGAIRNTKTLQLQNCTFAQNGTSVDSELCGGAIYNAGQMYAYKCTFTDNTSGQGGALYNVGSSELIECTFTNNSANIGGGIYSTGTMRTIDTLIYQNLY